MKKRKDGQSQIEYMTKTPVPKLITTLAIPTILCMLGTTFYNLVDTAFVGSLGNSQSGALSVVFGLMGILQAIGFMFGQGGGSLLSRSLGAKDEERASTYASTGFFSSLAMGILIGAICFIFKSKLVVILGSTPTIQPYAETYVSYILLGAPFIVTSFTMNNYLRYEGRAVLGTIGLMTGGFLNIGGDALFMLVFKMGIAGAGLSTALSQIISFSILLSMFLRGKTYSKLSVKKVQLKGRALLDIVTTGFPSLIRQCLGSIGTIALNYEAAKFAGDIAVAAMGIVSRVGFGIFSVALGIGQGFQPVCGFSVGAKKYKRLRQAYEFTVLLAEATMIVLSIIVLIFSNHVIEIFRNDPDVIEVGTRALRLLCLAQMVLPICMITEMMMQSSGRKGVAAFLSSLRGGILYIPLLLILPIFRGLNGVQEAQPLAYVLSVFPAVYFAKKYFEEIPKEEADNS